MVHTNWQPLKFIWIVNPYEPYGLSIHMNLTDCQFVWFLWIVNLHETYRLTIRINHTDWQYVWNKQRQKKLTSDDATLLMAMEKKKLAKDNKELLEKKLERSHRQQTHTTKNTTTSFAKEKETYGGIKNSKWIVPYGLSIHRSYKEKKKGRNEEEEVKRA